MNAITNLVGMTVGAMTAGGSKMMMGLNIGFTDRIIIRHARAAIQIHGTGIGA